MHFFSFKFIFCVLILLNIEIFSHGAEKPHCSTGLGSHKMRLSHRYGPCSPFPNSLKVPSSDEILRKNEARVRWLSSRVSNSYTTMDESSRELSPSGPSLGNPSAQYVTTIGVGTPTVDYKVIIDTGSDKTWLRCKPCIEGCTISKSPLYDPFKSSTYIKGSDGFNMKYSDGSTTTGTWSYDTFKHDENVINKFQFGCGQHNKDPNKDDFSGAAGVLGLGPGDLSLVSQFPPNMGKIFGYCLPKGDNQDGYLVFGDKARKILSSSTLQFTRLSSKNPYYFLELLGISVAGTRLDIPSEVFTSVGTIIDSGTVVTHLPKAAYNALSSAFNQSMSAYEPAKKHTDRILEICYINKKSPPLKIPPVAFHFAGGIDVDLDESGIGLYDEEKSVWCLAFAATKNDGGLSIIGNTQQREMQVLYDIEGGKIGFGGKGCGQN